MLGRFSRILIVDDSPVARRIMRMMLHTLGFDNVDEAANGRDALAKLGLQTYRVMISDWDMAPINGLELLHEVRRTPRLKRLPFILATAGSQRKFAEIARDDGVTYFLPKPFTPEMLADRIARVEPIAA